MSDDDRKADLVRFSRDQAEQDLALHAELAPAADRAAERVQEFGDTQGVADTYRELAAAHREAVERIKHRLTR